MAKIFACARFVRLIFLLCKGFFIVLLCFPFLSESSRALKVQGWSIQVLSCLGILVNRLGELSFQGPLLIVSNHISWLDVLVLHSQGYCRFIAKSEIRSWPVVGFLTQRTGMFFIERGRSKSAVSVMKLMTQALANGDALAVFPEGTTSDGLGLLPFHANLIEAAVVANAPVLPVCISYVDRVSSQYAREPSFVGDITFLQSLWITLSAKPINAVIHVGELEWAGPRNRKEWAKELRDKVLELMPTTPTITR
jgi:1-acyl-sn-glycerol-3-phosphate acyltransferase